MAFNDYWQENKRFVVTVASGAILFVIGSMVVSSFFGSELQKQVRAANSDESKLRTTPMFGTKELELAQTQNDELQSAIDKLSGMVEWKTRPRFLLDEAKGPASNQYFGIVSSVREELLRAAGRANLRLPEDLGLPALSPTREQEIQKTLEAFDLVERVVHLALDSGVERVDRIEIKLDPGLAARSGVGEIERTRVTFVASGAPQPLVRLLLASQARPAPGADALQPLVVERCELVPARNKEDEATLEAVFCVVRLHPHTGEEASDGAR
ncbi:MAG: hypothetical protein IPJ19_01695 [Planctomycetes bacterium]|nr:hypothetical protein [Planctomycetota bacterium]